MRKLSLLGAIIFALTVPRAPAYASAQEASRVTNLGADNYGGPQVFVATGGHRTAKPPCATDDAWAISNPSTDNAKAIYSTILTIFAANREVTVMGTGACDPAAPTRETVSWINAR